MTKNFWLSFLDSICLCLVYVVASKQDFACMLQRFLVQKSLFSTHAVTRTESLFSACNSIHKAQTSSHEKRATGRLKKYRSNIPTVSYCNYQRVRSPLYFITVLMRFFSVPMTLAQNRFVNMKVSSQKRRWTKSVALDCQS